MKRAFTRFLSFLLLLVVTLTGQIAIGQTGVLNPDDPIVVYNPSAPPAYPAGNTLAKWVKTDRLGWNTSSFKSYFYNGIAFRLKFPKNYKTDPVGKTYPLFVFFHGVGERGSIYDNEFQLFHGGQHHFNAVEGDKFDGFLLYPQTSSASGGWSDGQLAVIADLIQNYLVAQVRVDPFRVNVNGLSGGGGATWAFMNQYKTLTAAALPMSGTAIQHKNDVAGLVYNTFWIGNGGLDNAPAPATVTQVVNEAIAQGANYRHSFYPNIGHGIWTEFWNNADYFPYMMRSHKANPWPRYGRTEFCPGDVINVSIGVTAGFSGYQWRRNGVALAATGNTIQATDTGTYDVRLLRNGEWSVWSPIPVKIVYKATTISPDIQVSGLASKHLPSLDGKTSVNLTVPTGYTSYTWQKLNPTTTLSATTNTLTGATVGSYQVRVTEQYGCSSNFSTIFNVVDANGTNPPPAVDVFGATTLSQTQIRLKWQLAAAGSNVETAFEIYQATSSNGAYKLIGFAPARVDSFIVDNLDPNTRYYYKARAINNTAASAASTVATALTLADNILPTAPANLRTGTISPSSVELLWEASVDNSGIKSYDVYVNGVVAYTIPGTATSFTVYNLPNGQYTRFIVKAKDLAGNVSSPSNQVTAAAAFNGLNYKHYTFTGTWNNLPDFSTLTPVTQGNVPNVTLSNRVQDDNFAYMWEGFINITEAGSYTFRTSSDDGSKLYLGTVGGSTSPYGFAVTALVNNDGLHGTQDRDGTITLTPGVYPIAMTFYEQGGGEVMNVSWRTPGSGSFVAIPNTAFAQVVPAPGATPAKPSGLTASAASAKKIIIGWQDNSNNETGFEIYRASNPAGPFNIIATTAANTTTYSDSSLEASTVYYYKLRAINNNGYSEPDVVSVAGVQYSYYELFNMSALPNFNALTPKKTGTLPNFALTPKEREDDYAFKFSSFIMIPTAGTYTFFTSSDDGSKLYIGEFNEGNLVVNNDGLHGNQEASGTKYLTPGAYPIHVTFFERGGDDVLTVRYQGPGISKQTIPTSVLGNPAVNDTTFALPALPAAPSLLTGAPHGAVKIDLSWTNNAAPANVSGYEVWHSANNNANFEKIAYLPSTASTYTDSSLNPATVYYYKVRAVNEGGNSSYTNEINVTTSVAPVTVVTFPAIANQTISNDTTVVLNLAATSDQGTTITYTTSGLPSFATLESTGATTGKLTLAPGSEHLGSYSITLTATDNFGGTASRTFPLTINGKNAVTINLNFNQTLPQAAPWNNTNSAPNSGVTVNGLKDLNGNTTSTGVTLLSTFTGSYSNAVSTGNNSGVFPDNVMKTMYFGSNNAPYQFRLTGLSALKKYSLIIHAGYPWTAQQQAQSGTLICNYTVGSQTVTLNAANNTSQTVRLNGVTADASGYITVTMTKAAGAGFAIINAMQIISYDGTINPTVLNPPTNVKANGLSATQVKLDWSLEAQTRTGIEIWRSSTPNGTYDSLTTVGGNVTTYTNSGLTAGSTFFYKLRSVNGTEKSVFTSAVGASTESYIVNLNLNSEARISEPAPWNNFNTLTFSGYLFENMVNMKNQKTGINFYVDRNFTSFHDGVGISTGNNSGAVPDNVMKTLYYTAGGDTAVFSLTGLNRTHIYNFEFFTGSTFGYTSVTQWWVGSQLVSLEGRNNTQSTVTLYGLKPDSTGKITVYMTTTNMYGFLNALMIHGMVSPDMVEDVPPVNNYIVTGRGSQDAVNQSATTNATRTDAATATASALENTAGSGKLTGYPNPFSNNLTLKFDFKEDVSTFTLAVTDLAGRTVYMKTYSQVPKGAWQQTIDFGNKLAPGQYIVNLRGLPNEKPKVIQVVKQ
jgi:large repetitive protein